MFTKPDIEKYFMAEKQESLVFMIIGVIALVSAIVLLLAMKSSFAKGMAIPLIAIGLIQFVVGYTVYKRSDQQRIDNVYSYDMNPVKLKNEEVPRMEKVMKNFVIYRYVEIALILLGAALVFLFKGNPEKVLLYGIGIGLEIQAFALLIADYFAEKRGHIYLDGLKEFLGGR